MSVVAFDFDGTLADTMSQLTQLAIEVLSDHYDLERHDAAQRYLGTAGRPFDEQLEILFPEHSCNFYAAAEFAQRKVEIYKTAQPFYDTTSAIQTLNSVRDSRAVIVSSTIPELIFNFITQHKIVVEVPDVTLKLIKFDQIKYVDADIFVGDTLYDAQIACWADIGFIGLPHTFASSVFTALGHTVAHTDADILYRIKHYHDIKS